jgi:hypothetical protein
VPSPEANTPVVIERNQAGERESGKELLSERPQADFRGSLDLGDGSKDLGQGGVRKPRD